MKKHVLAALLLVMVLLCGIVSVQAEALTIHQDEYVVPVGKTRNLKFTNALKGGVSYESSDSSVATVNYKGQIEGKAVGECTVTITCKKDPSQQATVSVQVVKPVKKIALEYDDNIVFVGETMQIAAILSPEDATIQEVTFSSSNPAAASVDEDGFVTAHKRGSTTISVKSADGNAKTSLKITVQQKPEEIKFKKSEYTVAVGKKLKFSVKVLPSDANNRRVTYESSDPSIATVDAKGNLRVHGEGDVTISAISEADSSVVGEVTVHCVIPIQSISFEQTVYDLTPGQSVQLYPSFKPDNATVSGIDYASRNARVCTVDENGVVTGVAGGETTVSATSSANRNRTAKVTIRVHVPTQGAKVDYKGVRLDVGKHMFATVKMQPQDATNKGMTWVSSDPSVAVVTNSTNRPRIEGLKWGRAKLTGTTVDGGYQVSFHVNVGALHDALHVNSVTVLDGQVYVTLINNSDMHMTGATLSVKGGGAVSSAVQQLELDLAPGAISSEIALSGSASNSVKVAVAAWETDTGFYTNADEVLYDYQIAGGLQLWK